MISFTSGHSNSHSSTTARHLSSPCTGLEQTSHYQREAEELLESELSSPSRESRLGVDMMPQRRPNSHTRPRRKFASTQTEHASNIKPRIQGRRHSIGCWHSILATLSVLTLLSAMLFISWLWWEDPNTSNWRRIMLGSFSTRVITITALIIRTAMGSLAMIATSMLAAIMIERRGVLLEDAPAVSIARFGTTGPESLFMLLLRRNTMEPTLRVLVVLLLLNTLAAQFVSTILLSDTSNGPIVTFPNTFSTGIGVKNGLEQITFVFQTTNSYNYLKTNPSTFE